MDLKPSLREGQGPVFTVSTTGREKRKAEEMRGRCRIGGVTTSEPGEAFSPLPQKSGGAQRTGQEEQLGGSKEVTGGSRLTYLA